MLEHGGRLRRAAAETGTSVTDWLDLSTGISPYPWPIPEIPPHCWQRLPEDDDGLIEAACAYYGASSLLPVDGSQCAIQLLPRLRPACRVAVLSPSYAEHGHAWRQQGHRVTALSATAIGDRLAEFDVVVVVNPNNPTGDCLAPTELMRWHRVLRERGGWLVADEAFMDATPQPSLAGLALGEGLIVLRSFGKFFGCPGARLGFVLAHPDLLAALRELVGPWPIAGPARWIGREALSDFHWHEAARALLQRRSGELADLLSRHGLKPTGGTALFQWVRGDEAGRLYRHFADHGILLRYFNDPPSLRFGLPGDGDWERLAAALAAL